MTNFTIGCDPEVFIKKAGAPASAHGLLPGNKENPHKTEGGAIQVDGMAAEFNTDPVSVKDFKAFNVNILLQMKAIRDRLPEGYNISIQPTQEFGKDFLDTQPDEAKELGCDPDYNAYTLKENPRPDAEGSTFRTGAGHIHVGWGADIPIENEEHFKICADFVKTLDLFVGLFMVLIDDDTLRMDLYGKAGAFRPKPYGVEYRTPSNVWIKNVTYRRCIHYLVERAIFCHSRYESFDQFIFVEPALTNERVQEIINSRDIKQAYKILKTYNQHFYYNDVLHSVLKKVKEEKKSVLD